MGLEKLFERPEFKEAYDKAFFETLKNLSRTDEEYKQIVKEMILKSGYIKLVQEGLIEKIDKYEELIQIVGIEI